MLKLNSMSWWIETFVQTFIVMIFIYLIKMFAEKGKIPIVKDIAENV